MPLTQEQSAQKTDTGNSMNEREYKSFNFKVTSIEQKKAGDDSIGYIKGYASTFGNVDRGDDVVERGAFLKTIDQFRRDGKVIPMCFQHSQMHIIGGFDPAKMYEDEKGLHVEGEIYTKIATGAEVYELAKHNVLSDMSIGYGVVDQAFDNDSDNGRTVRKLKEVKLYEISMVAIPMNPLARVTDVKSAETIIYEKAEKNSMKVSLDDLVSLFEKADLKIKDRKYLVSKIFRQNVLSKNAAWFIVDKLFPDEAKQEQITEKEVAVEQSTESEEKSFDAEKEICNVLAETFDKYKECNKSLEMKLVTNELAIILSKFK